MNRMHWKKTAVAAISIVLLLVLIVATTPLWLDLNRYNGLLVSKLEDVLGGKVQIGVIDWGISNGLWLEAEETVLKESAAIPCDVAIRKLRVKIALAPLLTKAIHIKEVALEAPDVQWRMIPAEESADALPPDKPKETAPPPLPEVTISQVSVTDGRLVLEEELTHPGRIISHSFRDIQLTARDLRPDHEMAFSLALEDTRKPGLGKIAARGRFSGLTDTYRIENPKLNLSAAIKALDLSAVTPYLKSQKPGKRLKGPVSLEISYDGDLDPAGKFRIKGDMDLSGVIYNDPELWESPLGSMNTRLAFQVASEAKVLSLENLTLNMDESRIQMGARLEIHPPHLKIKNPLISAELDLKSVSPLIPWVAIGDNDDPWRQILEAGGRLYVDRMALPDVDTAHLPDDIARFCEAAEAHIRIADMALPPLGPVPQVDGMSGSARWEKGVAIIDTLSGRMGGIAVPQLSGTLAHLFDTLKIQATLRGKTQIEAVTDKEMLQILHGIGLARLQGNADLDLNFKIDLEKPGDFELAGQVRLNEFSARPLNLDATAEKIQAEITLSPQAVDLKRLSAEVGPAGTAKTPQSNFNVTLQARLADWRQNPKLVLQDLSTSPISLRTLAALVPWQKLGEDSEIFRQTLSSGGTLSIDTFSLPPIQFNAPPRQWLQWAYKANAGVRFDGLRVQLRPPLPLLSDIQGNITLKDEVFAANNVMAKAGPVTFPRMDLQAKGLGKNLRVEASATGPLTVSESSGTTLDKHLMSYGFSHLDGVADMRMKMVYDEKKSHPWAIQGQLALKDVSAKTHPDAIPLEQLNGSIQVDLSETLDLTVTGLTARVNDAPIRLSGKISDHGASQFSLEGNAYAERLDLSHLGAFFPRLKEMKLSGEVDMDLNARYFASTPLDNRISGHLKTRELGLHVKEPELAVSNGNAGLLFDGDTARIQIPSLLINDQPFTVSGEAGNLKSPTIELRITAADLNIDQLLPPPGKNGDVPTPSQSTATPASDNGKDLPAWAENLSLTLKFIAPKGRLRGQTFQDLFMDADYEKGLIRANGFYLSIAGGRLAATGTADIREPGSLSFELMPEITDVQVKPFMALWGMNETSIRGPLSVRGTIGGKIDGAASVMDKLKGEVNVFVGAGNLTEVGPMGQILSKILTLTNIKGIISGQVFKNLTSEGIPFESVQADLSLENGLLDMTVFSFDSPSLDITADGEINLTGDTLDIKAVLSPLGTIDKIIGAIPVVGKATENLTKIHLDIKGPTEDPNIRVRLIKGVTEGIKELFN